MKNLETYNVTMLNKKEISQITGGNDLSDLGAWAAEKWCTLKKIANAYVGGVKMNIAFLAIT